MLGNNGIKIATYLSRSTVMNNLHCIMSTLRILTGDTAYMFIIIPFALCIVLSSLHLLHVRTRNEV